MKTQSLIEILVPQRGEVPSPSQPDSGGRGFERGFRTLPHKKKKAWEKRSEAAKKSTKRRNTPKRVLTPGKVDPSTSHKKVYTRRRTKAE